MKTFLLLLSLSFIAADLRAQTADEIYNKYVTAAGGVANAEKIKTVKLTSMIAVQGMEFPMTQQVISGRGVKTDVEVMGTAVTMAYLDGKGWKVNQFMGVPEPTAMDANELVEEKDQVSPISPLFDSKKNGDNLALAGEETLPEGKAWKLKATSKDGRVTSYFVNSTSFDLVRMVTTRVINGTEAEVETTYGNYKTVEGVRMPYTISNKTGGQVFQAIRIEKYEINVPVDEKTFAKPD